jgi:hypothetical protein
MSFRVYDLVPFATLSQRVTPHVRKEFSREGAGIQVGCGYFLSEGLFDEAHIERFVAVFNECPVIGKVEKRAKSFADTWLAGQHLASDTVNASRARRDRTVDSHQRVKLTNNPTAAYFDRCQLDDVVTLRIESGGLDIDANKRHKMNRSRGSRHPCRSVRKSGSAA